MSTLRISTSLGTDDGSYTEPVTYPVQIMDEEGSLIAETAASQVLQVIDVPDEVKKVFVRAFLPSGEKQTKRFELSPDSTVDVKFFTERVSPHEWLAWSRPHIALQGLDELRSFVADFEDMWIRTWIWNQDQWADGPKYFQLQKDKYAASFTMKVPDASVLLQIGGTKIPWRLVSLPPGDIRVALSINRSIGPKQHPVRIVHSRSKPAEEVLLAFLGRNEIAAAETMSRAPQMAERLLHSKYDDPVSACVGAYFLLRTQELDRLHSWPRNLFRDFPWLPDAAVIYATMLIRQGRSNLTEVMDTLELVMRRGLPIYAEGLSLYCECLQLLNGSKHRSERTLRLLAQASAYVLARTGETTAVSFLGVSPSAPNAIPRTGGPEEPKKANPYKTRGIAKVPSKGMKLLKATGTRPLRQPSNQPSATTLVRRALKAERKQKSSDAAVYIYGPKAKI